MVGMRRVRVLFHLALLSGALLTGAALADADREIIRAAFIEFPPLTFTNEQGQAEGSFIDLTEKIARRAGYQVNWQELPIGRVYLYLEQGIIDLWPGSASVPELASYTRETNFLPGTIRLNAYHLDDTPPAYELEDLQGSRLILIRGYTYFGLLESLKADPETFITVAPDHRSAIRMLRYRRGDYLVNFQAPMDALLAQSPMDTLTYNNLLSWPLNFVFSASAPGTETMILDFNRAWIELQAEGVKPLASLDQP